MPARGYGVFPGEGIGGCVSDRPLAGNAAMGMGGTGGERTVLRGVGAARVGAGDRDLGVGAGVRTGSG